MNEQQTITPDPGAGAAGRPARPGRPASGSSGSSGSSGTEGNRSRSFWAGRSELIMPLLVGGLATWLAIETATMNVMGDSVPGPQFFPTIVCIVLFAVALVHTIQILRQPRLPDPTDEADNADWSSDMLGDLAHASERGRERIAGRTPEATLPKNWKTYTDWKTVGLVVGGVAGFILVLPVLGWVLSAAGLFWVVCKALGSKRPVFDLIIALVFSSIIQLAFNAGLGLNLPGGFLEGLI